ncbi:efflux RND transporter periplasmic adaptor subunit [Chondrinema litorale]|uniref:efflux RND transporter periplasmic adaptor subunit n=1 Tax=Chondrinema litorale TaxID=2994555 RepID=UPI002543298F|nr:efflux RND transporter periplasmic adaptor subunit [Chondrinema litorale]UZR98893.1 efflux RND transporter periplasmic adaptor subunit [Chondrinema litorale]
MKAKKLYTILLIATYCLLLVSCSNKQTTMPVEKDVIDAVFASGHITTSDEYIVTANTEGYITKAYVKEGDSVKIDKPLFTLSNDVQSAQLENAIANYNEALSKANEDSPQIRQLQIQIEQAKNQLELDKKNYERYASLVKSNAVSQVEFDKIKLQFEASQNNLEVQEKSLADLKSNLNLNLDNAATQLKIQQENNSDYILSSSINGKVLDINKSQGELAKRGEAIARIGGGDIVIKLFVAEEDINYIIEGQKAVISLNTEKEKLYDAVISKVYPSFDKQEQSFIVEATFSGTTPKVYDGTQLQANIIIGEKQGVVIIPSEYLQKGDSVMLEDKNKKVAVKTGIKNDDWVEIIAGVNPSDKIAVK